MADVEVTSAVVEETTAPVQKDQKEETEMPKKEAKGAKFVPQIIDIDISKIETLDVTDRTEKELKDVDDLVASMGSKVGQVTPIVVRRSGTKYLLLAGKRRVAAAKKLKWTSILACVVDGERGTDELKMLADNLARQETNPVMQARAIKTLIDNKIYTTQLAVAEAMGVSQGFVSQRLALLSQNKDVQQAIAEKVLPVAVARMKAKDAATKKEEGRAADRKSQAKAQAKKRSLKDMKDEVASSTFYRIDSDVLRPSSGEWDPKTFQIWTSKKQVKVQFLLSAKDMSDGLTKGIAGIIKQVGEAEVDKAIRGNRRKSQ